VYLFEYQLGMSVGFPGRYLHEGEEIKWFGYDDNLFRVESGIVFGG